MKFSLELINKINENKPDIEFTQEECNLLAPCIDALMLSRQYYTVTTLLDNQQLLDQSSATRWHLIVHQAKCYQNLSWGIAELTNHYSSTLRSLMLTQSSACRVQLFTHLYQEHKFWHHKKNISWFVDQYNDDSSYKIWLMQLFPEFADAIDHLIQLPHIHAHPSSSSSNLTKPPIGWQYFSHMESLESHTHYCIRLLMPSIEQMPIGFKPEIHQALFPMLFTATLLVQYSEIHDYCQTQSITLSEEKKDELLKMIFENGLKSSFEQAMGGAVLFESMQQYEDYLEQYSVRYPQDEKAIFSSLGFRLPLEGQWDRSVWRKLLCTNGRFMVSLIGIAPKIEAELRKNQSSHDLPISTLLERKGLNDLINIAAAVIYPKLYQRVPDYIRLSIKSGISINSILDGVSYWKKNRDKPIVLPKLLIKGEGELSPYYLCQITNETIRVLTLGLETGCCQHYEGEGQHYQTKGISHPYYGFYAVMKRRHIGKEDPAHDEIRMQCYAWLGHNGLVIDSMESMRPREIYRYLPLFRDFFMQALGYTYYYQDKAQCIERIVIGQGGKTPKDLTLAILSAEQSIQHYDGDSLGDASRQYLAADFQAGQKRVYAITPAYTTLKHFFSTHNGMPVSSKSLTDERMARVIIRTM